MFKLHIRLCWWCQPPEAKKGRDDPKPLCATVPCDVLVVDAAGGRLGFTGSRTERPKSSTWLMFNPFDPCREAAFPEFLVSGKDHEWLWKNVFCPEIKTLSFFFFFFVPGFKLQKGHHLSLQQLNICFCNQTIKKSFQMMSHNIRGPSLIITK